MNPAIPAVAALVALTTCAAFVVWPYAPLFLAAALALPAQFALTLAWAIEQRRSQPSSRLATALAVASFLLVLVGLYSGSRFFGHTVEQKGLPAYQSVEYEVEF
jgi:hypothetical protein